MLVTRNDIKTYTLECAGIGYLSQTWHIVFTTYIGDTCFSSLKSLQGCDLVYVSSLMRQWSHDSSLTSIAIDGFGVNSIYELKVISCDAIKKDQILIKHQ